MVRCAYPCFSPINTKKGSLCAPPAHRSFAAPPPNDICEVKSLKNPSLKENPRTYKAALGTHIVDKSSLVKKYNLVFL